jgi:hypothetical protein
MLRKSVAMPSQQASAVLSNCHIKRAIRHKNMQNIPDIWPYPQLSVLLHRQKIKKEDGNRKNTITPLAGE